MRPQSELLTLSQMLNGTCDFLHGMLKRCYGEGVCYRPSYEGCVVDEEWHLFSEFKKFYDAKYIPGCELDKDLIFPGNKVYSSKT